MFNWSALNSEANLLALLRIVVAVLLCVRERDRENVYAVQIGTYVAAIEIFNALCALASKSLPISKVGNFIIVSLISLNNSRTYQEKTL